MRKHNKDYQSSETNLPAYHNMVIPAETAIKQIMQTQQLGNEINLLLD